MRKPRFRDNKWLAQSHRANKLWSNDSNLDLSDYNSVLQNVSGINWVLFLVIHLPTHWVTMDKFPCFSGTSFSHTEMVAPETAVSTTLYSPTVQGFLNLPLPRTIFFFSCFSSWKPSFKWGNLSKFVSIYIPIVINNKKNLCIVNYTDLFLICVINNKKICKQTTLGIPNIKNSIWVIYCINDRKAERAPREPWARV